ncbi:MAG: lysozyme [Henriciella sp.]|uniref:lysozyme n=1 Tax=Henriciella sp. TaxID=1968823 RepID=UPI0032EB2AD8
MGSDLRTSEAGLKLIMAYEGFRSHSTRLPDGRWVIGYGHTRAARAGLKVSQQEAAAILREFDLPPIERALKEMALVPLNQHEFDALVSFVFNIGVDQFETSDVLAALNGGDRMAAAVCMETWRNAKVGPRAMIVDPLVRRRADEKALFLKTVGTVPLAASSRFRPQPDEIIKPSRRSFTVTEAAEPQAADQNDLPDETATEAAARNVKERLTRILGEYEAGADAAVEAMAHEAEAEEVAGEASVEEIRAAISALVAEDDEAKSDLEPLDLTSDLDPEVYPIEAGLLAVKGEQAGRRKGQVYIDDVSEIELPPADPDLRRDADAENASEMIVFALIALTGALVFLLGGAMHLGWFGMTIPGEPPAFGYLPPFLMLTGGLIFLVMAYYWTRAVASRR